VSRSTAITICCCCCNRLLRIILSNPCLQQSTVSCGYAINLQVSFSGYASPSRTKVRANA
jgi:hypothetical protein